MNSQTKPMMASGLGLATAAAMVASAVALPITHSAATLPMPSISSAFTLVDSEHHWNNGNGNSFWDSEDFPGSSSGNWSDSDDDEDGDHHGGRGSIFNLIGNFLTNNQAAVEAFAAGVPTFYLGPVAVGQGVLASAFYTGYNGSATGLPGVLAYVTSQIGNVTEFIKNAVLTVTGMIPAIPLGPVWVGGSRLANAFFDGYNGSATGVAGIISYVTASLGLQVAPVTPAAASKTAAAKTVAASAVASLPRAAAATVSVAAAKAPAATRKVARSAAAAADAPRAASASAGEKAAPKAAAASRRAR